jgi:hypothetical protein
MVAIEVSLLVHNGSLWNSYTATTRDGVNNSIETTSFSAGVFRRFPTLPKSPAQLRPCSMVGAER